VTPAWAVPIVETPPFTTTAGAADSSVILHVPHSSTRIPADARESILLDDAAFSMELARITDAHTDVLAREAAGDAWLFINQCSRLVVDPERFPDDREEMNAVGMGAVYTATSQRETLRLPDPERDARLIDKYFHPYAQALTDLVDRRLARCGRAVILDIHSYPAEPLPYELHIELRRPAICLGVDETHTPAWLVDAARESLGPVGECLVNEPFIGTYAPLKHYGTDTRVSSIMVEIRRDIYGEPDGSLSDRRTDLVTGLARLVGEVAQYARG